MKALFLMFAFAGLVIAALFSRETVRAWRYDLGYGEEELYVSLYVRDFLATITFHFTSCHEKLNAYFIRE